jgi:hypothetical protein
LFGTLKPTDDLVNERIVNSKVKTLTRGDDMESRKKNTGSILENEYASSLLLVALYLTTKKHTVTAIEPSA